MNPRCVGGSEAVHGHCRAMEGEQFAPGLDYGRVNPRSLTEGEEFAQVEDLCPYPDHLDRLRGDSIAPGEE